MDRFRAILSKDERSPRALELTSDVIALNPANFTLWHFRRRVLEALGSDLLKELEFLDAIAEGNHKNYQIWHHRRWVIQELGKDVVYKELQFTEGALSVNCTFCKLENCSLQKVHEELSCLVSSSVATAGAGRVGVGTGLLFQALGGRFCK